MKIVVLMKEVPDTYSPRKLDLETGLADRAASDAVLDEICERALEAALTYANAHEGTQVTLLSMSPNSAQASLRKGLALGADAAVQITDPALIGADLVLTAEVLAAAVTKLGFDLVIAGNESTDGAAGTIPAMLAELLKVPSATGLSELVISDSGISGVRVSDDTEFHLSSALPVVVSITESLPEARFPSFKGIMAAKKKPMETFTLEDLGIDPDVAAAARSIMISLAKRPPRPAGTVITDEGDAGTQLADFLSQRGLV